mmetsp:Transcript_126991/g.355667  ORF Transcript_126991/g.355667 Transcript_126991/m.355667 type:complete len:422 (-) Transcript_126991:74-1339(-)
MEAAEVPETWMPRRPELLVVAVPRDEEIEAVRGVQHPVPPNLVPAREVRHDDLPVRRGRPELRLRPGFVLGPEIPEPLLAGPDVAGTARGGAAGAALVVALLEVPLLAADVVFGILGGILRIHRVRVDEDDVHGEALVGVVHTLEEVWRRHHPTGARPSVRDLLVPPVVEDAAAPIVVAEDAEPWHAGEPRPLVDTLEDLVELVPRLRRDRAHGRAAIPLDAAPIEIIAYVQDVRRLVPRGMLLQLICDEELWLRVHLVDIPAASRTWRLALRLVALHELIVRAHELGVRGVPAGAREDGRPRHCAPPVCDEPRPAIRRDLVLPQGAVQPPPIADGYDVHVFGAADGHLRQGDALVVQGLGRRTAQEGSRGGCRQGSRLIGLGPDLRGEKQVLRRGAMQKEPGREAQESAGARHDSPPGGG